MVGHRIKARRESLGMTQDELAEKVGYKHKTSISKIENNKTDISTTDLETFAEVLETTVQYLMGWDANWLNRYDPKNDRLVRAYEEADAKTKDIVNRLLDIETQNEPLLIAAHENPDGNGDNQHDIDEVMK